MLKRYFKSLDREGWTHLALGVLVFLITCLLTSYIFKISASFIRNLCVSRFRNGGLVGNATIGSIYRHKDGRTRTYTLQKKEYLDRRFQAMYGGEVVGEEEESSDGSEGTDESSDKDE